MPEQENRIPQGIASAAELDYRKTLIAAGRKLQPLDLSGHQKRQLLITVSDTLFPRETNDLRAKLAVDLDECRKSAEEVFGNPKLFIAFQDLVSQLTDNPYQLNIIYQEEKVTKKPQFVRYENTWETSAKKMGRGESDKRLAIVLAEHVAKYPDLPVNYTALGKAIGNPSRQYVYQVMKRLRKNGLVPEGIKVQPQGFNPKKSA